MEAILSKKQIQQIADMAAEKTAKLVLRRMKAEQKAEPLLVSLKDAARILGVSVNHMRSIKDEYPHIRRGKTKRGHIYFIRESLEDSLQILQAKTNNK